MYDIHYDLLTILYFNLKKNNPLANEEKLISDCLKIYKNNNIEGGIINLYFESSVEMKESLGIDEDELNDVIKMFKKSIKYLKQYQKKGIIPKDIDYIYGIEGCDFLKSEKDLDTLYALGLRSIIPVWNNPNQFGSGIRGTFGITNAGIKLIKKAIDLGMIIDVSHANEKTFFNICNIVEEESYNDVTLITSHSNVRSLCNRERNLTDKELYRLKELDGYIGLFTNGNFVSLDNKGLCKVCRIDNFLKHIDYVMNIIKFDPTRILISTDNMDFEPDPKYHKNNVCPYEDINEELFKSISKKYDSELANMIMRENAKKLIHKVK